MNSKIITTIEIVLILGYLGIIISGLIPTNETLGLIILGVVTLLIFGAVFGLEKVKKKSELEQPAIETPVGVQQSPPTEQPIQQEQPTQPVDTNRQDPATGQPPQ